MFFNNRTSEATSLLIATMNRLEEGQSQLKETVQLLHRELISVEAKIGDIQRMGTRIESLENRMTRAEQCESGDLLKLRERVHELERMAFKLENAIEVNSQYWDDFHLQQTQVVAGRRELTSAFKNSVVGVFGNLVGIAVIIALTLLARNIGPDLIETVSPAVVEPE
jgi:tetrahydromethanopterin S-methyltransferase subunit B